MSSSGLFDLGRPLVAVLLVVDGGVSVVGVVSVGSGVVGDSSSSSGSKSSSYILKQTQVLF